MIHRYSSRTVRINTNIEVSRVYDEVLRIEVFRWYGPTGAAKCEVVKNALNTLDHGKD